MEKATLSPRVPDAVLDLSTCTGSRSELVPQIHGGSPSRSVREADLSRGTHLDANHKVFNGFILWIVPVLTLNH